MPKPVTKTYAPTDERVATFRIQHQTWEAFQAVCERGGISASSAITRFIDSVIDAGLPGYEPVGDRAALEQIKIGYQGEVESAIASLRSEVMPQLDALSKEVDALKKPMPVEA
jgi:antitoxin component of RelBE/YafQ-DinJ toxin-antitoxin module